MPNNTNPGQRPNGARPNPARPAGARPGTYPHAAGPQRTDRSAEYARRQREYARRQAYEAEMARRREIEKQRKRKKRQQAWEVFVGRALLFVIIFAVLAVLFAVGFAIHFNMTRPDPEIHHDRYFYGGAEGENLPEELAVQDGVLYVDFTAAAE